MSKMLSKMLPATQVRRRGNHRRRIWRLAWCTRLMIAVALLLAVLGRLA